MAPTQAVLITGCSEGGIGHALAQCFQARDFKVFASARDLGKMGKLATLPNVTPVELDVTNAQQIAAAVELVTMEAGSLAYLVNNAAAAHFMPMLDQDIEQAKHLFDTNVWGPLAMAKAFAPLVIKAKGTLVNISSISGYVNVPWIGVYAASKRSMEIMAETLRLELSPFDVGVLSVVTGSVQTNGLSYFEDWRLPVDSIYKPIEETIHARAKGHDGVKRMSLDEYANRVVSDICQGATGKIWFGSNASTVKFGSAFAPQGMIDGGLVKGSGIDILLREAQSKAQSK